MKFEKNKKFDLSNPIDIFLKVMEDQKKAGLKDKEQQEQAELAVKNLLAADPISISRTDVVYVLPKLDSKMKTRNAIVKIITENNELITGLLHLATYLELPFFINSLLRNGADVNQQDNQGMAPLHYLALIKNTSQSECLKYLKQDIKLRKDTVNNEGYSAFSLLGICREQIITEIAFDLLHDTDLSNHDLNILVRLSSERFNKLSQIHPRIMESTVLAKLANLIMSPTDAGAVDGNYKYVNDRHLPYLLSCNKEQSKENAMLVFKFLTENGALYEYFMSHRYPTEKDFTSVCDLLNTVKNNPLIYADLVDKNKNTIVHILLMCIYKKIQEDYSFSERTVKNFYKYLLPIFEVYETLLNVKNIFNQVPISFALDSNFQRKVHMTLSPVEYRGEIKYNLINSFRIDSVLASEIDRQDSNKARFFNFIFELKSCRFKLLESLYFNDEQTLLELMYPLNSFSHYLYPEIVRIISQNPSQIPSNQILSALRLQLIVVTNKLVPIYQTLLSELHDYFISHNKKNAIGFYPFAQVVPKDIINYIYGLSKTDSNFLLGLRLNIHHYIGLLSEIINKLINEREKNEKVYKVSPNTSLTFSLDNIKKQLENLKAILSAMINIAGGQVYKQQLNERILILEREKKEYKQLFSLKKLIDEVWQEEHLEQKAWNDWKSENITFIFSLYEKAIIRAEQWPGGASSVAGGLDPFGLKDLALGLLKYKQNFQDLINNYLRSYDVETLKTLGSDTIPSLEINASFNQVFDYKVNLKAKKAQLAEINETNDHINQRMDKLSIQNESNKLPSFANSRFSFIEQLSNDVANKIDKLEEESDEDDEQNKEKRQRRS